MGQRAAALTGPGRPSLPRERLRLAYPFVIALATAVAYFNSTDTPFILDDHAGIAGNPLLRRPFPSWAEVLSNARIVVTWTLAANYAFGGVNVQGYHVVNLIIHLLAGLTLYNLVRQSLLLPSLKGVFDGAAPELALVVAVLWVVHPLQTQSVTYTIQRSESLMWLFSLLTLYCVVRGATADGNRRLVWYADAVLACGLGMKSKEVMVTAPFVALLYDRAFLAGSWREVFRRRWPVHAATGATLLLLFGPVKFAVQGGDPASTVSPSAGFGMQRLTPWEYARSQPGVLLQYLRLSIWPDPLCLDYGWPVARSAAEILPPALAIVALLAVSAWAWFRHPALGFLGAWFFLVLTPTSSVMPIADLAFEHRMYLPLAAVVTLAVLAGYFALQAMGRRGLGRCACWLGGVTAASLVGVFTWLTVARNADYRRPEGMWRDVIAKRPLNYRGHANLGKELVEQGRHKEGLPYLRRGAELNQVSHDPVFNLGLALADMGRVQEAVAPLEQAVRLDPTRIHARYALAVAYTLEGRPDDAIEHFAAATTEEPRRFQANCTVGLHLLDEQKTEEARRFFLEAVRLHPRSAKGHFYLGLSYSREGKTDEAIRCFRETLRLDPSYAPARGQIGLALVRQKKLGEAREAYEEAVRMRPGSAW